MVFKLGYIPWNKGLTKEVDERIKRQSESEMDIYFQNKIGG